MQKAIVLIIAIYMVRKKRRGFGLGRKSRKTKRVEDAEAEEEEPGSYEDQEYYVPPPPSSKR